MPNYNYKAIDDKGRLFKGTFVAFSDDDVEQRLKQNGLTLIKSKRVSQGIGAKLLTGGRIKPRVLIELYHRLAQTLELGLSLVSALDENAQLLPSKPLKKVLEETRAGLERGNTLYESMSRFPKVFQKLDLAIIRMGEQSGVLPKCMKDLADFLEWKEDIRSVIKKASIYPSFVVIVLAAVIGVWVGYVLPQMATILKEMDIPLPGVTKAVFSTSLFLQSYWLWIIGSIFSFGIFFYLFQKTKKGGILFHKYLLKVPILGNIATNIAVARLSHNFATMFRAGMTISVIFEILTDNVLGNRYLEGRLTLAFQGVQRGQSIASAFENAGGFPPLLLGGIRNGEITGTLDDSFSRLADYYDGEVKRTVQAMLNAIEPITIIILGGVFGLIVLSIMLPLYDVIGSLGNTY
jgi:type II secretory pathway component PulF